MLIGSLFAIKDTPKTTLGQLIFPSLLFAFTKITYTNSLTHIYTDKFYLFTSNGFSLSTSMPSQTNIYKFPTHPFYWQYLIIYISYHLHLEPKDRKTSHWLQINAQKHYLNDSRIWKYISKLPSFYFNISSQSYCLLRCKEKYVYVQYPCLSYDNALTMQIMMRCSWSQPTTQMTH